MVISVMIRSGGQAWRWQVVDGTKVISSDPEVLGGTPVFTGTRVPVQALIDYLEAGKSLVDFLNDFPTVTREQAIAALEAAKRALLADARPA
jgi:uncharacterized protein (DUF433 family)